MNRGDTGPAFSQNRDIKDHGHFNILDKKGRRIKLHKKAEKST